LDSEVTKEVLKTWKAQNDALRKELLSMINNSKVITSPTESDSESVKAMKNYFRSSVRQPKPAPIEQYETVEKKEKKIKKDKTDKLPELKRENAVRPQKNGSSPSEEVADESVHTVAGYTFKVENDSTLAANSLGYYSKQLFKTPKLDPSPSRGTTTKQGKSKMDQSVSTISNVASAETKRTALDFKQLFQDTNVRMSSPFSNEGYFRKSFDESEKRRRMLEEQNKKILSVIQQVADDLKQAKGTNSSNDV
jgi:hypothetical protein